MYWLNLKNWAYLCNLLKTKKDIRSLSQNELTAVFKNLNEPAFRAKQVYNWLWQKCIANFEEMSNLSKDLRTKLEAEFFHKRI